MIMDCCLLRNLAIIIRGSWQHFLPVMILISYCTIQVLPRDYSFLSLSFQILLVQSYATFITDINYRPLTRVWFHLKVNDRPLIHPMQV